MKRPYQIMGLVLILLSVLIARLATELKLTSSLGPGPGFFPFWLSVLLGLLAAIMLYQATFRPSDPMPQDFYAGKTGYVRIAAITLALVGSVVLMQPLGFRLTMLGFYLFLLFALGRQNPVVSMLVSLAGSFGVFYIFESLLDVPLPVGVFGI